VPHAAAAAIRSIACCSFGITDHGAGAQHDAAMRDELSLSVVGDVSPWLLMLPVRFELPSAVRNKVRTLQCESVPAELTHRLHHMRRSCPDEHKQTNTMAEWSRLRVRLSPLCLGVALSIYPSFVLRSSQSVQCAQ
jgi:hypothetical protein